MNRLMRYVKVAILESWLDEMTSRLYWRNRGTRSCAGRTKAPGGYTGETKGTGSYSENIELYKSGLTWIASTNNS